MSFIYRVFLFIVIMYCDNTYAQRVFVLYEDFNSDFNLDSSVSKLSTNYDLLYILLLDSTHKEFFFEHEPELKEQFPLYSVGLKSKESTIGFLTRYNQILDVFDKEESRIFNCLADENALEDFQYNIFHPIYVKGNTAIVTVTTIVTSDVYYFSLLEGVLQINRISRTIE